MVYFICSLRKMQIGEAMNNTLFVKKTATFSKIDHFESPSVPSAIIFMSGSGTNAVKLLVGVSQVAVVVKNPPVNARDEGLIPGLGRSPGGEEGTATHSNILAWRSPWTEEPGGLQSIWSQRVGHD